MIAADTSAVLHFLNGFESPARHALRTALSDGRLVLPMPVVTELLSGVQQEPSLTSVLGIATRLPLVDGYWERTGESRRKLKLLGMTVRLADALIAQACIDADTPLITGDVGFGRFAAHCGLKLAI